MTPQRKAPAKDLGEQIPSQQLNCNDSNRSESPNSEISGAANSSASLPIHPETLVSTPILHSNPSSCRNGDDANDTFSDSSNSIPSSERPRTWSLPYVSVSRLIRGQQQQKTSATIPAGSAQNSECQQEEQRGRSSSSGSDGSYSVSSTIVDPTTSTNVEQEGSATTASDALSSLGPNSRDDSDSLDFLVHAGYGDIENQYPVNMDHPVPLTFQERRARLWSYASSANSSKAVGNLTNDEINSMTTHDNFPQPFLHETDSECSSNASSSDESDNFQPFHSFYQHHNRNSNNASSSLYNNAALQHQFEERQRLQRLERQQRMMMVTRSILFPSTAGKSTRDPQRRCATYMFSVLVGSVVLTMLGLYALVATSGLLA